MEKSESVSSPILGIKKSYARPSKNPRTPLDKIYYSNYLITLNSNIPVKKEDSTNGAIWGALEVALDCALERKNWPLIFEEVIREGGKKKDGGKMVGTREWNPDFFVEAPKLKLAFEVGKKRRGRRIHVHAMLKTVHYRLLKVNKPNLKEIIGNCIQEYNRLNKNANAHLNGFYLDVRWAPSSRAISEYLRKNARSVFRVVGNDNLNAYVDFLNSGGTRLPFFIQFQDEE